jgi:DNA-binding transcriptional ArsR family regulator
LSQQKQFKALADAQRRRILRLLQQGPMSAGEIATHFEVTGATLSHHLAQLKTAELVRSETRGQQRIYSLNTSVVEEAMSFLMSILDGDKEPV